MESCGNPRTDIVFWYIAVELSPRIDEGDVMGPKLFLAIGAEVLI
jgi:hypothetical protein